MRNRDSAEPSTGRFFLDNMLVKAYTSFLLKDRKAEFGSRGGVSMIARIQIIVLSRPGRTRC